jgi:hypothetical protein
MIMTHDTLLKLVLIGVVLCLGGVAAAGATDPSADLSLTKSVISSGPYYPGSTVQWLITLRNNGPENATNITVTDEVSGLAGLQRITVQESTGTYNATSHEWTIPQLNNASTATLTLNTVFRTAGDKTNRAEVTSLTETDPDGTNNTASATVHLNESPLGASCTVGSLKVTPETMNIHSNGVFTVTIALSCPSMDGNEKGWWGGFGNLHRVTIDTSQSSLVCSGATLVQWMRLQENSILAKFRRPDLVNVSAGTSVEINCSGTLVVGSESIPVSGSDTIRVIDTGEGWHSVFARLLSLLHLLDKNQDGQISVEDGINISPPLNISDIGSLGFPWGFHAHPAPSVSPSPSWNEKMNHTQEQEQNSLQNREENDNRTADDQMKEHQKMGISPNRGGGRQEKGD